MKMKRAKLSYAASLIAVLSCLFFTTSRGGATDESSSRQPRPCWKHRLWGLRMLDEGGVQCTTATFINPYQIIVMNGNDRQTSSALHVEGKQKKSHDDMNADLENDEQQDKSASSLRRRSKDEWIDGQKMMQLMEMEKAREEQERQRQLEIELFNNRFPHTPASSSQRTSSSNKERVDKSQFVSRITYTDSNTLQIELPPSGVDSNVFFSGAFTAMWFSAIAPVTLGMLSGGVFPALFMAPFWLAGGVIAKTAIVDPFVSSKLTIGDFLWIIEKTYFRRIGKLTSKTKEGSTESLKGSSVEVGLVVNKVPRYELRLFFDGETLSFGSGLSYDELEYLSKTINEHCAEIAKNQKLQ